MSEFQLLYMRFLQCKRDFPNLRHDGHGPTPNVISTLPDAPEAYRKLPGWKERANDQREIAEREFYRGEWQ